MAVVPTEDQVIDAVRIIKQATPTLGRSKILAKLKSENSWVLSETRLKRICSRYEQVKPSEAGACKRECDDSGTGRITAVADTKESVSGTDDKPPPPPLEVRPKESEASESLGNLHDPPLLPEDALAAQRKYRRNSGWYRIFGRGNYDYSFLPHIDMDLLLTLYSHQIIESVRKQGGRQALSDQYKRVLGTQEQVQQCFLFYEYVADTMNIPVEDVGRQFEAEYGVNPLEYRPVELADPKLMILWRVQMEESFEQAKLTLMRTVGKGDSEIAKLLLNEDGEPVKRIGKHSQFASIVKRIEKNSGDDHDAPLQVDLEEYSGWV